MSIELPLVSDAELNEMMDSVEGVPEKKRKREVAEYQGTEKDFESVWSCLKGLFSKHPEAFNEWTASFTEKMLKLERRFSAPSEFFNKLSAKQKTVIDDSSKKINKALEESGADTGDALSKSKSGTKRRSIQTLNEEEYALAWDCLKHMSNPLTSAVEFNYLTNIAMKLREYKHKALLSVMEKEFLKKISVSIPERKENKQVIVTPTQPEL